MLQVELRIHWKSDNPAAKLKAEQKEKDKATKRADDEEVEVLNSQLYSICIQ